MKASKTREMLDMINNFCYVPTRDELNVVEIELKEIERLAEIGKAVEKAFNTREGLYDETVIVVSGHTEDGGWIGYETLKSINELINWSKLK